MYADYNFYRSRYGGTQIAEEEWTFLAGQASDYIDYITCGKAASLSTVPEAVQKCCCALAERYRIISNARKQASDAELQSESVGSYSRTYRSSAENAQLATAELSAIAKQYLLSTGLLYRGGIANVRTSHCDVI